MKKKKLDLHLENLLFLLKIKLIQKVKQVRIDQGREFRVYKLESWRAVKGIKIEYTIAYSPKINRITERINSLIVIKALCLLLNSNLHQFFWPETFDITVYFLNHLLATSLDYKISFKKFLKAYHNDYSYGYMQDFSHFHIWGYKVLVHISQKKQLKSQKKAVSSQEGFFVGYKAQNIYKIFIKKMNKIEKLRDVKFIEDNQLLITYLANKRPFHYLDFISKEKNELLPMEINNLSNNNNKLSPIHLNTEISLYYSTKTWYLSDKYGRIA